MSQKFMEQNLHVKLWAYTSNALQHVCCLAMIQGSLTKGSYGYQLVLLLKSGQVAATTHSFYSAVGLIFNRDFICGALCCYDEWDRPCRACGQEGGTQLSQKYDINFYSRVVFILLSNAPRQLLHVQWNLKKDPQGGGRSGIRSNQSCRCILNITYLCITFKW